MAALLLSFLYCLFQPSDTQEILDGYVVRRQEQEQSLAVTAESNDGQKLWKKELELIVSAAILRRRRRKIWMARQRSIWSLNFWEKINRFSMWINRCICRIHALYADGDSLDGRRHLFK